ncbi:TetR family transcriptional regulator [Myroides marinus]|uniref:TetR family transcriptional regulator n=1 Tax=Myroides marinus TaxID=703342 RepID=A0A161S9U1_9FLAO|nr:TetR/AcrR family transcriptional regulator [Myroides marinus]KZE76595.1 TetR family transcriptional regulator [Myroides marinus]
MTKAEKTRQFIIEETAYLFNTKGAAATSLSDITEATGLTKGSIYGNFKNKDEVALAVFEHNAYKVYQEIKKSISKDNQTQRERLLAIVDLYKTQWSMFFELGGCPLLNTATEADDTFPELKQAVIKTFSGLANIFIKILEKGQENKEFKTDIDIESYAYLFISLIEGGMLLGKTTGKIKHLHNSLDRIAIIINSEITL